MMFCRNKISLQHFCNVMSPSLTLLIFRVALLPICLLVSLIQKLSTDPLTVTIFRASYILENAYGVGLILIPAALISTIMGAFESKILVGASKSMKCWSSLEPHQNMLQTAFLKPEMTRFRIFGSEITMNLIMRFVYITSSVIIYIVSNNLAAKLGN